MSKALKAAIEANDAAAVRMAMTSLKDLTKKLPKAEAPTAYAAEVGADAAMAALLEGGAPVVTRTPRPFGHPFAIAANKGHVGVMKVLAAHGGLSAEVVDHVLYRVVLRGDIAAAKIILELCRPAVGQRTMEAATQWSDGRLLTLLLEHGADVDARNDGKNHYESLGVTALHEAAWAGQTQSAQMLLDAGADVNARDALGRTALMRLAERIDELEGEKRRLEKIGSILKRSIGLRGDCDPPDGIQAMRLLLGRGADARLTDRSGNDALAYQQWASLVDGREPSSDGVALLRAAGAVGAAATVELFRGIRADDVPAIRAAIQAGADVNRRMPQQGPTPLMWCRSVQAVEALLAAGADPNRAGRHGSPLISAARSGDLPVVKLLVEAGADIHAIEPHQPGAEYIANAYSAAQGNDKPDVAAYLKSLGADQPRRADWNPLAAGVHSWEDFSEILVKGEVKAVAEGLARMIGGRVRLGVYGLQLKPGKRAYVVVRPSGMGWCNVWPAWPARKRFEDRGVIETRCREIAAACSSDVIIIDYNDTADAALVVRSDATGRIETDDGWDRESLEEMVTHLGADAPAWAQQRLKESGDDDLTSAQRLELLAAKERFVAAAFGFYCEGGTVEVDVGGYPVEAFDDAAFVTTA